ncbi:MAG TPA: ArsR family transcriptional regulator [Anaerolineae bacterium]|nr:ArsR family transcriptional regulator [Anaerolineae bacterium]
MLKSNPMATATRDIILRTLRAKGKCSVKDLAEAASVSPVSVRHHLASLQAQGLIAVEEMRHGVGRPRHMYSLTEQALELFPTRYLRLANRLIEEIKESMPEGKVLELFAAMAENMAEAYAKELKGLPLDQRMQRLTEMLTDEGFDADFEEQEDAWVIRELSCPYLQVGLRHPEVCHVDHIFIATALSLPVERVSCLLRGDAHCTYKVNLMGLLESENPDE